jgi:hypothetical protein
MSCSARRSAGIAFGPCPVIMAACPVERPTSFPVARPAALRTPRPFHSPCRAPRALSHAAHFATRHLSRCLRTNILRRTSPALWRTSYLATGRPPRRMPPASSRASCYVARLVALPM